MTDLNGESARALEESMADILPVRVNVVNIYLNIFIYTCVYIHIYIYIYICRYIHTHKYINIRVCEYQ